MYAQFMLGDFASDSGKRILVSLFVTVITAICTFLLGRYWGRYHANRDWQAKEFFDRVTFSLNLFDEGKLKIRTIMERSVDEVFLNRVAIEKIITAAKQCTLDEPILPIPPSDRWYLLNYALNCAAEPFASGYVRRDAGLNVTLVKYLLFLTCEVVGGDRIRKVRVMLVKDEILRDFPYQDSFPTLENPWHDERIKTLRKAAVRLKHEPDYFLNLEVCV